MDKPNSHENKPGELPLRACETVLSDGDHIENQEVTFIDARN